MYDWLVFVVVVEVYCIGVDLVLVDVDVLGEL